MTLFLVSKNKKDFILRFMFFSNGSREKRGPDGFFSYGYGRFGGYRSRYRSWRPEPRSTSTSAPEAKDGNRIFWFRKIEKKQN